MTTFKCKNLFVERPHDRVWIVRFVRADLRDQLDDTADAQACLLYQELFALVLCNLRDDQIVILNFGLVEPFPTAFYRCLLQVREEVTARKARLFLCQLSQEHQELFRLLRGFQLFHVTPTEGRAIHEAMKSPSGHPAIPS